MNIVTPEFQDVVDRLIADLKPSDCFGAEEYRLAQEFHALPLGLDLWSYGFLRPDGELISTEWEPDDIQRSRSIQDLIRAIVVASGRYPQLTAFIPERPEDAIVCLACRGTKVWGIRIGTNKPARCVLCAGLGWMVTDA